MRVGIGALVGILGGPATYARELIAALARLGGHEYVVFTDRPEGFAGLDVETIPVPLRSSYHQVTWDHWALPALVAARGVRVYHGTKNVSGHAYTARSWTVTTAGTESRQGSTFFVPW